jgi:hypothetical protein
MPSRFLNQTVAESYGYAVGYSEVEIVYSVTTETCVEMTPDLLDIWTIVTTLWNSTQLEVVCTAETTTTSESAVVLNLMLGLLGWLVVILAVERYKRIRYVGNTWWSYFVSWLAFAHQQPGEGRMLATCTLRSLFNNTPNPKNFPARNHTHPNSAAARNNGSTFMDTFGAICGYRPYFLQRSAADVRNGRAGCRTYYWGKDLTVGYSPVQPNKDDLLCIVDADMYMDIPALLCDVFQPVLISTFQPTRAAKSDGEYAFYFKPNGSVHYAVAGGAKYEHPVWNYGNDVAVAVTTRWWFINQHHVYNIDRRRLDEHHELILLTPIKTVSVPFFDLSSILGGQNVRRLNPIERVNDKDFVRLTVCTKEGLYRSTGKADTMLEAWTTAKEDDTIASLALISKIDLTPATIKTVLGNTDQTTATILTEYHRARDSTSIGEMVYPVGESVFKFQYTPETYTPEAKASMIPFMSPIILGGYAPDRCLANDQAAINGRVLDIRPPEIEVTPNMARHMTEFLELLIPTPHAGHPVSHEEVYNKQHRPAQRMILDRASMVSAAVVDDAIQSFQKSEMYEKITDPRIISTIPGVNKNNYSRFIYSFTNVLRATRWYAFALTPLEVAKRVATVCLLAMSVCLTDLSRFDGRVAAPLRRLEHLAMMRYFHKDYHKELCELMASQKNQRAVTTFGIKYPTGDSRASGSAETADFNSLDNAFMAYTALRNTINPMTGAANTPQEAWEALGIYGGDDGLTPDVNPDAYVAECARVGQKLEIDMKKRGDVGVSFLARLYGPEVWYGAMDSMCDITRQLSKLHTTVSLPPSITPFRKAVEKLYSYYLTDKNTPIIGDLASMIVRTFPDDVPSDPESRHLGLATYNSLYEESEQYPNSDSANGWMDEAVRKSMPEFDHAAFKTWLNAVEKSADKDLLLKPPMCGDWSVTHKTKVPVVVNGEVVTPPRSPDKKKATYTPEQLASMKQRPCRESAAGTCKRGDACRFKH